MFAHSNADRLTRPAPGRLRRQTSALFVMSGDLKLSVRLPSVEERGEDGPELCGGSPTERTGAPRFPARPPSASSFGPSTPTCYAPDQTVASGDQVRTAARSLRFKCSPLTPAHAPRSSTAWRVCQTTSSPWFEAAWRSVSQQPAWGPRTSDCPTSCAPQPSSRLLTAHTSVRLRLSVDFEDARAQSIGLLSTAAVLLSGACSAGEERRIYTTR